MKIGFLFLTIGAALLFLSPGNIHRLELTNALEPDDIITPDEQWTPQMFLTNFVIGFLPVFLREVILFVPIILCLGKATVSPAVKRLVAVFAGASIMVLLLMMCSPEFPERAGFPSTIFLLIASLAATVFAAVWTLSVLGCLYVECDLNRELAARDEYIAAHKHDDLIVVKPLEIPHWIEPFTGTRTWDNMTLWWGGDLEPDIKGNRDLTFARYHGLNKIVTKEKKFE